MTKGLKGIVREPLLHFLLLGAFVFWLNARIAGPSLQRDDVVEVSAGQIDRLRQTWMMQWRRPPIERELRGLIDAHIRERGELDALFEENAGRYDAPTAISFSHIYFSVDRCGAEVVPTPRPLQ